MTSPIQLLLKDDGGNLVLNEAALRDVVDKDDVRDRHVVAVSVVGAFRKGKSFLVNFILRYLHNIKEEDWFGDDNSQIIRKFEWRAGEQRTTTGILLWPEVFPIEESNLAVIVLDTQGTFDEHATMSENTQIFSLSTLISSVQIYNISQQIQLDHLQHLQYFVEYGRLALEEVPRSKPFQRLVFLIRDWQHKKDKDFGLDGGSKYLNQWIQPTDTKNEEINKIGDSLKQCYTDVSCYLMPHPGEIVASGYNFTGKYADISDDFKNHIKLFVEDLLATCNLEKKIIGGRAIKFKDLASYIKMYIQNIQNDALPHPTSLLEATASVHMKVSVDETRDRYMVFMNDVFKIGKVVENFEHLHKEQLQVCLQHFDSKRKLQGVDVAKYKEELIQELQAEYVKLCSLNKERREVEQMNQDTKIALDTTEKWIKNYQTALSELCKGQAKQEQELLMCHSKQKSKCLESFLFDVKGLHYQNIALEYHEKLEKDIDEWYTKYVIVENEKKLMIEDEQMIGNVLEKCKDNYSTYMLNMCGGRAHVKTFDQVHSSALQSTVQYFHENTKQSLSGPEILAHKIQMLTGDIEQKCLEFRKQNELKEIAESDEEQRELLRDAEQRARENYHKILLLSSERPVSDYEFDLFEDKVRKQSLSIFHVIANQYDSKMAFEMENSLIKNWDDSLQEYKKSNKVKFEREQELIKNSALQMGKTAAIEIYRDGMDTACSSHHAVKDLQSIHDKACENARGEFLKHAADLENWETYWKGLIDDDFSRYYGKYKKENEAKEKNEQSVAMKTKELNLAKKMYRNMFMSKCKDSKEKTSNIHEEVLEEVVETFASKLENQNIQSNDIIDELKIELEVIHQQVLTTLSKEDEETCKANFQTALKKYKQLMNQCFDKNNPLSGHTTIERIHNETSEEALSLLEGSSVRTENVLRKYKNKLEQDMEELLGTYKKEINERKQRDDDERKRKEEDNRTKILNDAKSEIILKYQMKMNELCSGNNSVENLGSSHAKIMSQVTEEFNSRAREVGETNLTSYTLSITKSIQDYYDIVKKENEVKTKKELKGAESKLNSILNAARNNYHKQLESLSAKSVSKFRSSELNFRENAYAAFDDFAFQDGNEKYSLLVDKFKSKLDESLENSKRKLGNELSERILQEESENAKRAYISGLEKFMSFDSPVAMSSSHEQCKTDALKQFANKTNQCDADGIKTAREELEQRMDAYYRNLQLCMEEKKRQKNVNTNDPTMKNLLTVVAAGVGFFYGGPMGAVAGAGMANALAGGQDSAENNEQQQNRPKIRFEDAENKFN